MDYCQFQDSPRINIDRNILLDFMLKMEESSSLILRLLDDFKDALSACSKKFSAEIKISAGDSSASALPMPVTQVEDDISEQDSSVYVDIAFEKEELLKANQLFDDSPQRDASAVVSPIALPDQVVVPLYHLDIAKDMVLQQPQVPSSYYIPVFVIGSALGETNTGHMNFKMEFSSPVFDVMSIREIFGDIRAHQNILSLHHTLSLNSWVDTGQGDIAPLPWESGGRIGDHSGERDLHISVMPQSYSAKLLDITPIRETAMPFHTAIIGCQDCPITVFADSKEVLRELECFSNTTVIDQHFLTKFPFNPGAHHIIVISCHTLMLSRVWDIPFNMHGELPSMGRLHLFYGIENTYDSDLYCWWAPKLDSTSPSKNFLQIEREGVHYLCLWETVVEDPSTLAMVPANIKPIGDIMFTCASQSACQTQLQRTIVAILNFQIDDTTQVNWQHLLLIVNSCGPYLVLGVWVPGINSKSLPLKGHTKYVPSNSITEVWDPRRCWYMHSYIVLSDLALAVDTSHNLALILKQPSLGDFQFVVWRCIAMHDYDKLSFKGLDKVHQFVVKNAELTFLVILMACSPEGRTGNVEVLFGVMKCDKDLCAMTSFCYAHKDLTVNFRRDKLYFLIESQESKWCDKVKIDVDELSLHSTSDTTSMFPIFSYHLTMGTLNWMMRQWGLGLVVMVAIATTCDLVENFAAVTTSTCVQATSMIKISTVLVVISPISFSPLGTFIFEDHVLVVLICEAATICSSLGNEESCNFDDDFLAIGMKIANATVVFIYCSFFYTLDEVLILLKGTSGGSMPRVLIGVFLPRRCSILGLFSTILLCKVKAVHELYFFKPLFALDLFACASLDLYSVDVVPAPRSSFNRTAAMIPMLYLNLEDKVLIEDGGNVMNSLAYLGKQLTIGPKKDNWTTRPLKRLIWDPCPIWK